MRKISFWTIIIVALATFSSCKKEGCTDPEATNYNSEAKKNDNSCTYTTPTTPIPTSYNFTRNGASTVSFSGQTDRMNMLDEMVTYLKTANTPGTALDADKLKNMYANANNPFTDANLNSSTKNLKSKTAGGDVTIQGLYESYMDAIATISTGTSAGKYDGANGTAGVVQSGTKAYLFNDKGVELTQFIEKGLMGACFYHQITNIYLGADKMNADNEAIVDGKNYTTMEHYWDEAFGYFTNSTTFPTDGKLYWAEYSDKRNAQLNSNKTLLEAFIKGRVAIIDKDLTARDAQIVIIRKELERVAIATAVNYLNAAKSNLADDCLRNHELSEAVMFMDAIKYGFDPAFSSTEIEQMKATIGNNFYEVKSTDIDAVVAQLNAKL
ncbi:MAG: DUF4856 domain-containing protein [Crocinitomicaceae bacterium]|nr:DUF4856 domain-containing protein [Crocinitomicaceae bacterium]|tara:strand:- start:20700 stop:21845 length:1146 start_codon:yes stop_codon:yes gene_type:complete